jgi:hypothetical protein
MGFRALRLEFRSETGFLSTFTAQSVRILSQPDELCFPLEYLFSHRASVPAPMFLTVPPCWAVDEVLQEGGVLCTPEDTVNLAHTTSSQHANGWWVVVLFGLPRLVAAFGGNA